MEEKLFDFFITLNRINSKMKELCAELEKLNSDFIKEEFDKIFSIDKLDKFDYE
jgi:hypothetical protein